MLYRMFVSLFVFTGGVYVRSINEKKNYLQPLFESTHDDLCAVQTIPGVFVGLFCTLQESFKLLSQFTCNKAQKDKVHNFYLVNIDIYYEDTYFTQK